MSRKRKRKPAPKQKSRSATTGKDSVSGSPAGEPEDQRTRGGWLRHPLVVLFAGAVLGSPISVLMDRYFVADHPNAAFRCDTLRPEVGQELVCSNLSSGSKEFQWSFGEDTWPVAEDAGPVQHVFRSIGEKKVTLKALGSFGRPHDEETVTLTVVQAKSLPHPLTVRLVGTLRPGPSNTSRRIEIDESVLADPKAQVPEERDYSQIFRADKGYLITEAKFVSSSRRSAAKTIHLSGRNIDISPDPQIEFLDEGRAVRLTFQLRTDPAQGITTAWLTGALAIREERDASGEEVEIDPEIVLDRFRSYALPPEADLSKFRVLTLERADGSVIVSGAPDEVLRAPVEGLRFAFAIDDKAYQLQVDPLLDLPPDLLRQLPIPSAPPD